MAGYDADIDIMMQATKDLKTVHRPLPEKVTGQDVNQEMAKLAGFMTDTDALRCVGGNPNWLRKVTTNLVLIQRVLFNRTVWQITANSLVDGILVGLAATSRTDRELAMHVDVADWLCRYLMANHLVLDRLDLAGRFCREVTRRRSDLMIIVKQRRAASSELRFDRDFFRNTPVKLVDDEQTDFFTQVVPYEKDFNPAAVDFNQFITEVAAQNSPARLQISYGFFDPFKHIADSLLSLVADGENEESGLVPFFQELWYYAPAWTMATVLATLQVYHQFLKFCLTQQLMDAQTYAVFLRVGRRQLVVNYLGSRLAIGTKAELYAIFSKPNGTLNITKARQIMQGWQIKPKTFDFVPERKPNLALKRVLDDHQLALELNRAQRYLAELENMIKLPFDVADKQLYHKVVLQIHAIMVKKYNRRLRQWTLASLAECLQHFFEENGYLDLKPTFFRFFELYLNHLDDEGALGSWESCGYALEVSYLGYLVASTNRLSAKNKR